MNLLRSRVENKAFTLANDGEGVCGRKPEPAACPLARRLLFRRGSSAKVVQLWGCKASVSTQKSRKVHFDLTISGGKGFTPSRAAKG